jgi:hypothetical protein
MLNGYLRTRVTVMREDRGSGIAELAQADSLPIIVTKEQVPGQRPSITPIVSLVGASNLPLLVNLDLEADNYVLVVRS